MQPAPHRLFCLLAAMVVLSPAALRSHPESGAATSELTRLIDRTPDQAQLWFKRSLHYRDHGQPREAEADLQEVERLAPLFPGLDEAWAELFLSTGRVALARQRLDRAVMRRPSEIAPRILRARAAARLGDRSAALADYTFAIEKLPEPRPELFLERAGLAPQPAQALLGIEDGLERIGPVHVLLQRAYELEIELGRFSQALLRLDQLMSGSERKEAWLKRRGDLLAKSGRPKEALQSYHDAMAAISRLPGWLRADPTLTQLSAELSQLISQTSQLSSP